MQRFKRAGLPLLPLLPLLPTLLAVLTGAAAGAAAAPGSVDVSFVGATRYADAGATPWEIEANVQALAQHLQQLGDRELPAGRTLTVEILDVDLAGTLRHSARAGREIRIVKGGADWPSIRLRYTQGVPGRPVQVGQERLTDMNYSRGFAGVGRAEPLHFEKRLLDTWFRARIVDGRPAAD